MDVDELFQIIAEKDDEIAALEAQLEAFRSAAIEARDTVVTTRVCALKPSVFDALMSALRNTAHARAIGGK